MLLIELISSTKNDIFTTCHRWVVSNTIENMNISLHFLNLLILFLISLYKAKANEKF